MERGFSDVTFWFFFHATFTERAYQPHSLKELTNRVANTVVISENLLASLPLLIYVHSASSFNVIDNFQSKYYY